MIMMRPGQYVAAHVPYTKRAKSWIMATVVEWLDDQQVYVVEDCYPDKKKKVFTWQVTADKAISFPSPMDEVYEVGDKVLSLWLEDDQWSSMFYDAFVVEPAGPNDTALRIQYSGSGKDIFTVGKDRLVKRTKVARPSGKPKDKRRREDLMDDTPSSKRPRASDNSSESDDSAEEPKHGPKRMDVVSPAHYNGTGQHQHVRRNSSPRNSMAFNGHAPPNGGRARARVATPDSDEQHNQRLIPAEHIMNPGDCCLLRHSSNGPLAKKMVKLIALYAERQKKLPQTTAT